MNLLDLFSGIGGFHKGFEQAGFEFDWVGHSDVDKYANAVYQYNFPKAEELGSVKSIRSERLPQIDIITFGSPCQDFSIAGKRLGMGGSRSSLIGEAIRLISECKPRFFIWENVKGTFSSNDGEDFWAIIKAFTDIGGYRLEWQLCNTKWFLPQNRERIYLVGHLGGGSGSKIFPIGEINEQTDELQGIKIIGTTKNSNAKGTNSRHWVHDTDGIIGALGATDYKQPKQIELKQIGKIADGDAGRVFDADGLSCTLKSGGGGWGGKTGLYKTKSSIRRLTPKGCERLQGFPDDWTNNGQSDTQRYKQLGNAVSVPVVQAIAEKINKCIS